METRQCPRCGGRTLAGLSNGGRAAAFDVVLDPAELTAIGELDALHSGRRTWTVHSAGDIHHRGPGQIGTWPAGSGVRRAVHADHDCSARQTRGQR